MAKVVDKERKRKDIALACKGVILQKGLQNLKVSEMAKAAGVGKGTIYEYFDSKEEIVFELALSLMEEHRLTLQKELAKRYTVREKVKCFASFFYDPRDEELREIYKQFVALSLLHNDAKMLEFNARCIGEYRNWFKEILLEGVENGELSEKILQMSEGLFSVGDGLFLQSSITANDAALQMRLERFIDAVFDMMELS